MEDSYCDRKRVKEHTGRATEGTRLFNGKLSFLSGPGFIRGRLTGLFFKYGCKDGCAKVRGRCDVSSIICRNIINTPVIQLGYTLWVYKRTSKDSVLM